MAATAATAAVRLLTATAVLVCLALGLTTALKTGTQLLGQPMIHASTSTDTQ